MIVPPIGGLGGGLSVGGLEGLSTATAPGEGLSQGSSTALAEGLSQGSPSGAAEGVSPGSSTAPAGSSEGVAQSAQAGGAESASGEPGGFGGALTEAISSLEKAQTNASSASQALATGTVKDPESAVVTVEDAAMAMQLAAQIRGKATEAIQTIFQTQA